MDGGVRLRCAGTVRPRQVQCPLGWLAIAQVSASQHQLVSSGEEEEKPQFFRYSVVTATAPATVSFAWVCTAAADTHRPTAHPAKLPGTRQEPQEHLEHLHHRWIQMASRRQSPPCGRGWHYHPVCLKCWFCSRWMTATCTNSTFDSQRSNDGAGAEIKQLSLK